jgi:hypothetical protein
VLKNSSNEIVSFVVADIVGDVACSVIGVAGLHGCQLLNLFSLDLISKK